MRNKKGTFRINLTGKIFNKLTVLEFVKVLNHYSYWLCKCECGKTKIVRSDCLIDGNNKSCGCSLRKHGLRKTRFYMIWADMKKRCTNPHSKSYPNYGGRGITVCDTWMDFNNFKEDMYESYLKHVEEFGERDTTIERVDFDGNYERINVKWATRKEQNRHKRDSSKTENYNEHIFWKKQLSSRLTRALKLNLKISKLISKYLGCSIPEFKQYLQSKFLPGMTWDNHGQGIGKWNVDHIIGCNNFDLSKEEEDRLSCWNYTNLRPMWEEDHKKKSKHRILKQKI